MKKKKKEEEEEKKKEKIYRKLLNRRKVPRRRGREIWGHKEHKAWWEGPGRTGGEPGVTFAFTPRTKRGELVPGALGSGEQSRAVSCKQGVGTTLGRAPPPRLLPQIPRNP